MRSTTNRNTFRSIQARQLNRATQRLTRRCRMIFALSLVYVLVLSQAGVPVALAQNGPQPGVKDPVGSPSHYALFPSHDLSVFAPGNNQIDVQSYRSDTGLQLTQAYSYSQPADADQVVAASGRIWNPTNDQVVYIRRYAGTNVDVVFQNNPAPGVSTAQLSNLVPRFDNSADFMDLAVGDLDKVPDTAGDNHDEVVVVYATPGANNQLQISVNVLDYTAPASAPPGALANTTATLSHTINGNNFATDINQDAILPVDNVLGVAIGDFDSDGQNEIAVAHISDFQTMWITTLRYTNDGQGHRSLKEVSSVAITPSLPMNFAGSLDVIAGDFDGKGGDELFVGNSLWNGSPDGVDQVIAFNVFQGDSNLNLQSRGQRIIFPTGQPDPSYLFPFMDTSSRMRVQLSSGLFKYDPANGFDLNRRQVVAAWNIPYPVDPANEPFGLMIWPFVISDDLSDIQTLGGDRNVSIWWQTSPGVPGASEQRFSIAAGAYKGNTDIQTPQWSLALSTYHTNGAYWLSTINVSESAINYAQQYNIYTTDSSDVDRNARFPVTAFDLDGKSVYLGAPVRLTIEGVVNTDFILQEPPKHAFYDNRPTVDGQPNPTYGQIVNISRQNNFKVSLLTSDQQTFSASTKDSSTWNIGGSVQTSAGGSISSGISDIESLKLSVDLTAKVGYDYNQNKESYNSNYTQTTITQTEATDNDDKVLGRLQIFDIWRYRVYGIQATDSKNNPTNPFYEVVLPGPTIKFDAGGRDKDWYQPVYENGNLLSYPMPTQQAFTPSDLGSYRIPCPTGDNTCVPCKLSQDPSCNTNGTKIVTQPLVAAQQTIFDGTSGTLSYDYKNTISSGNSFGYSHTLTESADVKAGWKLTVSDGFTTAKAYASLDVNFHNSNSWGKSETSDTSTTSETGITINRVSGDSNQAYAFYPIFYNAQDGTVKVAHAVDILGGGALEFWASIYGRKSDPALNLPRRFSPVDVVDGDTDWVANTNSLRKKMRGLFFRKAELNPVTNDYDYLASTTLASDPTSETPAGEKVRVETRVYNYSTAVLANNLEVRFQVIGYDPDSDQEVPFTSCPNGTTLLGGRCTIGEANVTLNPLEMQPVVVVWDTTGFGPAQTNASLQYRVYVVLDPDNTIDEIYETEDPNTAYACKDANGAPCSLPKGIDPGQNNEGYGYITIQNASLSQTPYADLEADVSLRNDSLAAGNELGSIRFNYIPATINRLLMMRAKVYCDKTHRAFSHLLVYDGDPAKGGKTIAAKLVHSGCTDGSSVWFDWIPTKLGRQRLYAKVVEMSDDPQKGNNVDTIDINVVPADTTPPRLAVALTPNTLWPPDGRFVPVTATIAVKDNQDRRPEIRLEAITHNEGDDAGEDVKDAEFGTDDRTFSLRAKRDGRGGRAERVYKVVYSATDWAGNKTFTKAYVLVPGRRQP